MLSSVLTLVQLPGMRSVWCFVPVWVGFHLLWWDHLIGEIWLTDNLAYVCQDQSECSLHDANDESCGFYPTRPVRVDYQQRFGGWGDFYRGCVILLDRETCRRHGWDIWEIKVCEFIFDRRLVYQHLRHNFFISHFSVLLPTESGLLASEFSPAGVLS